MQRTIGRFLAFPSNVKLDWKALPGTHAILFERVGDNEKKVLLDFHQAVVDVHNDVDEGVEQGAETLVSAWNQTIEPVFRVVWQSTNLDAPPLVKKQRRQWQHTHLKWAIPVSPM